jgi:pyridoxal phosphate enzyme (YggS family)
LIPNDRPNDEDLGERAARVQSRIDAACVRAGRSPSEIKLIWVSKNHPRSRLVEAYTAGARLFGENRVQEVLEKFPLPENPETGKPLDYELHLIGHLQSNKARKALPLCAAIHSVDSPDLWQALNRLAGELGLTREVFLQVNTSGELQKSGFTAPGFLEVVATLPPAPHLRLMGLMTLGPAEGGPETARPCFQQLHRLLGELRAHPVLASRFPEARFLSMGMSGDFEVAVEEGAHYLRIGTALFGERSTGKVD